MKQLIAKMRVLETHMIDVAADMGYYGRFDAEVQAHSVELMGASKVLRTWIETMSGREQKSSPFSGCTNTSCCCKKGDKDGCIN